MTIALKCIRIRIFLFLLFSTRIVFSQCWDIRDISIERVKQYYAQHQFDSIDKVIHKWNTKCEMNEELFRLSILNAIQLKKDIQPLLDNNTIGYLRAYETNQTESLLPHYHALTYAGVSNDGKLKEITKKWAIELLSKGPLDSLEMTLLHVYTSDGAAPTWNKLIAGVFPNPGVQGLFNKIVDSSKNLEDYLSPFGGIFFHPETSSRALEFGFAYDRISSDKIKSFGGALRFGPTNQLDLKYEGQKDSIAMNSLFLFYDYGKYIKKDNVNYQFSLTASYSAYISDFGQAENEKRLVSVFGFGATAGIDFKGNKPDKWGLYIRYVPINIIATSEVEMNASFLTVGIKYKILKSDVSRQLLHPVGYFD